MFFCIQLCWMQGAFAQEENLYVRVSKENLRAEPNGKKLGELMSGTKLQVIEKQENWVKVQLTGWIWQPSLTADPTTVVNFQVRASHILVETQEEAQQLLTQLMQGADFAELARQHSRDRASGENGGDLGMFGRGDLRPEFEDAVFRLKVGSMSGVVKTDLGYHIIKRTG
jgi:hypothetical protein